MADHPRPDQPATKADLDALEQSLTSRFDGKLDALEQRLDGKLDAIEQRIIEKTQEFVRDNQTEILRAFARYSAGENVRLRRLQADHANLSTSSDQRFDN
jgi:hypothetical protein